VIEGPGSARRKRGRPSHLSSRVLGFLQDELRALDNGACLLPEPELAEKFGVSRKTVRAAMRQLELKGVIRRVKGKGTFPTSGATARGMFRTPVTEIGIVSWGEGEFYSSIVNAAAHEAMRQECQLALSGGPSDTERTEACWRLLDDHRIAGLVVLALTDQTLLAELAARKKPLCLVDHFSTAAGVDCVRVDSEGGSRLAMEHLLALRHRRIAYIDAVDRSMNRARFAGYRASLEARGIHVRDELIVSGDKLAGGADAALRLLALPEARRPTAILAFSDLVAIGAMQAILRFGLRVPEEISVVGFSGANPPLTIGMPELTMVEFDTAELGRTAVRCLLERLKNPDLSARNLLLPGTLKLGQSTGRAKQ